MGIWQRMAATIGEAARLGSLYEHLKELVTNRVEVGDSGQTGHVAFTIAVIALLAKMARSDGVVVDAEVKAFNEVMRVPAEEARNVQRVFDLAKRDTAGFESYANQIARAAASDRRLLQHVVEGLLNVAAADGILHPSEDAYLAEVARRFAFTPSQYHHIRSRFVAAGIDSPYAVLGIEPTASDDEIKRRYRELVAKDHPDKLIGRGVPEELVLIATRKLAAINAAYDRIVKERGA
ncbi:MAG TPA: TerB family tellurite resistance protein [Hyphomicrobiaceae bacterium]|nr:TerB family tellurite resistance protein [Hyphomicrobiaceae bacterium]